MKNNYFSNFSDEELYVAYSELKTLEATGAVSEEDGHGHMRKAIDTLGKNAPGVLLATGELQREISERWYQERTALNEMLHEGDDLWYVDFDAGSIEHGKASGINYKEGKLDSFGVDFDCGDYDVFVGEALGKTFYRSEISAQKTLLKGTGED